VSLFPQSNVYWPNIHSINLTLFNISRDDNNFQLTCIAENVVGMANSSVQLNVQCELHFFRDSMQGDCRGARRRTHLSQWWTASDTHLSNVHCGIYLYLLLLFLVYCFNVYVIKVFL